MLIAVVALLGSASPAFAHCPSTATAYGYVAGGNINNVVKSVRTTIGWVNSPNPCGEAVSHSITICPNGSCNGWIQVGWVFRSGYSSPKAYCERKPLPATGNAYTLTEFNVTAQSQNYAIVRTSPTLFECRVNGATMQATATSYLGFASGTWVPVQAEAHRIHAQLGHVAQNWMVFSETGRVDSTASSWADMPVQGVSTDDPVWNFQQPNSFGFWVNTDANH